MIGDKIATGCAGLDEVLFGGIPGQHHNRVDGRSGYWQNHTRGAVGLRQRHPGIAALYLTTLSEPLEKFIAHGQNYGFFDAAKVGQSVFYEDLGLILRERGISEPCRSGNRITH